MHCFNCCKKGHIEETCTLPPAPQDEKDRLKLEIKTRSAKRREEKRKSKEASARLAALVAPASPGSTDWTWSAQMASGVTTLDTYDGDDWTWGEAKNAKQLPPMTYKSPKVLLTTLDSTVETISSSTINLTVDSGASGFHMTPDASIFETLERIAPQKICTANGDTVTAEFVEKVKLSAKKQGTDQYASLPALIFLWLPLLATSLLSVSQWCLT